MHASISLYLYASILVCMSKSKIELEALECDHEFETVEYNVDGDGNHLQVCLVCDEERVIEGMIEGGSD